LSRDNRNILPRNPKSTEPQTAASFLEPQEPGVGADEDSAEPTPFEFIDEPPKPSERGYAKADSDKILVNKLLPRYRLHCHSSRNNTIVTFTKADGNTVAWASGGSCKFKKGARAGYEAGYQCAIKMFKAMENLQITEPFALELFFKGFGEGREAMKTALLSTEGTKIRPLIVQVTDRTPIKIGGTRSKKTRRV
jgi:small subunit ribosomal protein S11